MSGIYIPGMEMPQSCRECHFDVAGWCYATDRIDNRTSFVTDYPIQPWCPLVPVPPHGRCIDVDVLIKVLETKAKNPLNKETTPYSWAFAYECLADAVGDMPTIIPADHIGDVNEMVTDKEGEG